MIEDALAWAESVLGSPVVCHEAMAGGMTSTMLALRDASGGEAVLRLMTEEPWRTHGGSSRPASGPPSCCWPTRLCRRRAASGSRPTSVESLRT